MANAGPGTNGSQVRVALTIDTREVYLWREGRGRELQAQAHGAGGTVDGKRRPGHKRVPGDLNYSMGDKALATAEG
jgi:hypothetical protein